VVADDLLGSMSAVDAAKIWSLNYRLRLSVISSVEPDTTKLGLDSKELFLLAEIDEHPYPAELAATLNMPKATVTLYLKRLEAAGFVRREIDPADLRRHRLLLTPAGRQATDDGCALLSDAFNKRLERLSVAQQKELKSLLEKIV
jgi:DNA-binding MarR family transcriptional regulator